MANNICVKTLQHIAIIPDGNRRWARQRGLPVEAGHKQGFIEVAPLLLEAIWDKGIYSVTLWLFSTENWQRSDSEVKSLMGIFSLLLKNLLTLSAKRSVQLRHLGRKDRIPSYLLSIIEEVEICTKEKTRYVLNFALDYGGKDEIIMAVRRLVQNASKPEDIDEHQLLEQFYPAPDLIIRTSGEHRLSGFMPLQSCYSELYFTDTLFPDLTKDEIQQAINWFQNRDRRFGK